MSCIEGDRKIKINIWWNLKCGVRLWDHFLKILQVLTRVVTSFIQNWVKRTQTCISCTNGDRKMTIKSKRRFQVKYLFMKLFSRNLEIQVPYCDFVISKLGQRDSICISCTTGGKNIKIRTYNNLVHSKKNFWQKNFWILNHWSSLWAQ